MIRHLICATLVATTAPNLAVAQSGPEAAAQAFGNAIKANDWAGASRLMHHGALSQLRDLFQPLINAPGGEQVGAELFGIHSSAELAATPDTVLFASLLRAMMLQQEGLAEALQTSTFTPLGHVTGGGDTVLVVSRMTFSVQGITMSQFEVMPFILENGRWWGLLKADFTNMAAMLQRALGTRRS